MTEPLNMDRQTASIALSESEERFQLIANHINQVFFIRDTSSGRFIYISPAYAIIWGRTCESLYQNPQAWFETIHPDDRPLVSKSLVGQFQENSVQQEYRIILPDGSIRWIMAHIQPVFEGTAKPLRHVGFAEDITDRKQAEIQLREMSTALSNAVEGIARLDEQGCYIFANEAYAHAVRYTPEEMIGMNWQKTVHPADLESVVADYQKMLSTGKVELEARGLRKDASVFDKQLFMISAYDSQQRFVGHYCFMKDISERKKAEEDLRQSDQKLRAIFDSTFQFIGVLTPDGIVIDGNRTALDAVGAELSDVIGRPFGETPWWTDFPEQQQQLQQAIARAARGEFIRFESKHIWADGSTAFVDFSLKPAFDEQGNVVMLIPEGRDITDRKLAEQKIREQAALLDIASDAIFVRNLNHHILYWNQGAEHLYGWSVAEAIGQKANKLLQENADQVLETVQSLLNRGEWRGEMRKVTKTGKEVIVEGRWTLVRDDDGQPKSILVVSTDITEKKQLEEQSYQSQRLESLGTLASGIAHDLNNALTPILALSQLITLQQPNLNARSQEMLKVIETSAKRGAEMVQQILTFTRGTGGKRISVEIPPLLRETIEIIQKTFPSSIEIHENIADQSLWLISADPTQFHQVLMNLCINARDAMPNGGKITISAENCYVDELFARISINASVGNYVLVTVSDNGTGISSEVRDRIFEPFFTTKAHGSGTGLGLSTVLGIIKSYGGFVRVESEPEQGSQFKIYLPMAEGTVNTIPQEQDLLKGNGEMVLIVEDDLAVQSANRSLLDSYHYKTLVASNGIEAVNIYKQYQQEIKIVLMDIMMPNMDGITAIHTIATMNPQVKIVAMSGLSLHRDAALAAGAIVFLPKPYTLEELVRSLYELVKIMP